VSDTVTEPAPRPIVSYAMAAIAVVVLAVLAVLFLNRGPSANRPEVACSEDLEWLTVCVPGDGQRTTGLLAGVDNEADALAAQQEPLGGALGIRCNTFPERWSVCVTLDSGITVVTPISSTRDLRVSFTNDGTTTETMALDEPLGIRRESTDLTINFFDGADNEWGSIPLGFSPGRTEFSSTEDPT